MNSDQYEGFAPIINGISCQAGMQFASIDGEAISLDLENSLKKNPNIKGIKHFAGNGYPPISKVGKTWAASINQRMKNEI